MGSMRHHLRFLAPLTLALGLLAGCSDDGVTDEEGARIAYMGIDPAMDKIIDLGFQGFNAASSANIPQQSTTGDVSGVMTVDGKVDQGSSNNKGMRLDVALAAYSDGAAVREGVDDIVYDTNGPLGVDLSMKGLPDADLTGTLVGSLFMQGGLEGGVSLSLSISGKTEDDGTGKIRRKAGTVRITGTATSDYGVFNVDILH
jgi:hypothetical protein